jgi:peroxiredoxin
MPNQTYFAHDTDGQLSLGQTAPEFALPNVVDNRTFSLVELRSSAKAVVVIFSCNHCPWVIKYEERMIALAKEYQPRGVRFVVISSNDVVKFPQDSPEAMKERALQKDYPFPYLYDESQEIAHVYGALVTPHIFLFDGDFKLRYRGAIDDNPDKEKRATRDYLRDAIENILSGKPADVSPATTRAMGCSIKWK